MGKLTSLQKQFQQKIESTILKAESAYLSVAAKPFEFTHKFHSVHDDSVASMAKSLRKFNKELSEASIKFISKFEKEETKTEKAKKVINRAGKKTRKAVSQKTASAKRAAKSVASKVEEAMA